MNSRSAQGGAAGVTSGDEARPEARARGAAAAGRLLVFAALGILPDVDLLFGVHNAYTHSVGAALFVGIGVTVLGPPIGLRLACASAAAFGSHVLLDWLNDDTSPPIGIMALWPLTTEYYQSHLYLFMAIERRYWLEGFWLRNLRAVGWEIVLLGPLTFIVWWLTARRRSRT